MLQVAGISAECRVLGSRRQAAAAPVAVEMLETKEICSRYASCITDAVLLGKQLHLCITIAINLITSFHHHYGLNSPSSSMTGNDSDTGDLQSLRELHY